jgi:heme oxygenase (biliverdin-producing, ferredoxin)
VSLKEQTQDLHEEAEKSKFAQLLLSGNINEHQYGTYLANLLPIYQAIEGVANQLGLLVGIEDICRVDKIKADIDELKVKATPCVTAYTYMTYVNDFKTRNDKHLLLAHLYTRHFGDLYGGQIVKKKVPGSGSMYEFENRNELIGKTRSILSDDLGKESRIAFEYAITLFEDLEYELNL